jgi:hypothetical protein
MKHKQILCLGVGLELKLSHYVPYHVRKYSKIKNNMISRTFLGPNTFWIRECLSSKEFGSQDYGKWQSKSADPEKS